MSESEAKGMEARTRTTAVAPGVGDIAVVQFKVTASMEEVDVGSRLFVIESLMFREILVGCLAVHEDRMR
jgi:hypothetical protein